MVGEIDMSTILGLSPYIVSENEEYMNVAQCDHFIRILVAWRKVLMQEVDRTVDHLQVEPLNYPDPLDRAVQEEVFTTELRTRDRERKLIRKIDETRLRIEEGDYGMCSSCGAEIGVRRLEARPTATQCVDCKTYDEIREKVEDS